MTFDHESVALLGEMLRSLEEGFARLPDCSTPTDAGTVREVLMQVSERMRDNYPYPHPLYIGQMLKPPHPVARLAYAMAMFLNPNNHALDGGRASSAMEKEAVAGYRAHVRLGGPPRPPLQRRNDGQLRGPLGRARAASRPRGPGLVAGPLHAFAALGGPWRALPEGLRRSRGRMEIADLEDDSRRRGGRYGRGDARHDGRRDGGPAPRGPGLA